MNLSKLLLILNVLADEKSVHLVINYISGHFDTQKKKKREREREEKQVTRGIVALKKSVWKIKRLEWGKTLGKEMGYDGGGSFLMI